MMCKFAARTIRADRQLRLALQAAGAVCLLASPLVHADPLMGKPSTSAAWYPDSLDEIAEKSGEGDCFAEVTVPAQWREETEVVEIREASNRFEITAPRFDTQTEEVRLHDAYTEIEVVEAVTESRTIELEVAPAEQRWVRMMGERELPATDHDLAALANAGIDMESVEPGNCVIEHFEAAPTESRIENILVREERDVLKVKPAEFEATTVSVVTRPEHTRVVEVPAVFDKESQRVMTEPARVEWQKGTGMIQRIDNTTGEILCRVDIPPVYEDWTVERLSQKAMTTEVTEAAVEEEVEVRRLVSDAEEIRETLPAVTEELAVSHTPLGGTYRWSEVVASAELPDDATGRRYCKIDIPANIVTYEREVVKEPARFVAKSVPAIVQDKEVEVLAAAATAVAMPVPAETREIVRRYKVAEPTRRWESVLCETNINRTIVRDLQASLSEKGYDPGVVDGLLGRATFKAVEKYQRDNGLPTGGLTMETLSELGIEL